MIGAATLPDAQWQHERHRWQAFYGQQLRLNL